MTHPLTDVIGDALHIVDVDGTTYATDTYWMAPIPSDVVDLLRWWNLEPAPGRYEFDYLDDYADDYCDECGGGNGRGPLRQSGGDAVKAEKLTNIMDKLTGEPLQRVRTEDEQTYVLNAVTGKPIAAFTGTGSDGGTFYVYANPEYLRLAFGDNWRIDDIELRCPDPKSPIWAKSTEGQFACVMPVRL